MASKKASAVDLWKITCFDETQKIARHPVDASMMEIRYGAPYIMSVDDASGSGAADAEGLIFGKFMEYRPIVNAFKSGFPKAVKASKDGRLGYGLPKSEEFALHLQKKALISWAVRDPPDVQGSPHANASFELAKTLQPHLYGYEGVGRVHSGCDPRQLASVKFQRQGERLVCAIPFKALLDHLTGTQALERTSYSSMREWLETNMSEKVVKEFHDAGVPLFHATIEPRTMLFMPPGFFLCECTGNAANFGVRLSLNVAAGAEHGGYREVVVQWQCRRVVGSLLRQHIRSEECAGSGEGYQDGGWRAA